MLGTRRGRVGRGGARGGRGEEDAKEEVGDTGERGWEGERERLLHPAYHTRFTIASFSRSTHCSLTHSLNVTFMMINHHHDCRYLSQRRC